MRSHPVLPAELSWIFATRPVFLYLELLPCVSLDPALYCPRRTAAFTAAEDCLLVLGLRNMEGSSDPTKLVSQFVLRKTLVQVRRRILQCCRPGVPDNIVKAFRYQRVLWPMLVACRPVDPTERRPPVEREEQAMPPWLVRSLPVIYSSIREYNCPPGSAPEAPPPRRSGGVLLSSASKIYSFPPGTRYPPRLPAQLAFRRVGFVQQQPRPPPGPASVPSVQSGSAPLLRRLFLTKKDSPPDITSSSAGSMTTRERIRRHSQTLAGLRRRRRDKGPAPSPVEGDDVIRTEEEEEESHVVLVLSESDPEEAEPGREVMPTPSTAAEEEDAASSEDGEDAQRACQDVAFAEDYLLRVCDAVAASPGAAEQLLEALDQFSEEAGLLYERLSGVLGRWPQLLRDFAAFLSRRQARRCGLLVEQQLFERSRRFLRRLGRSLGEGSAPYQQVVFVLQGSSAPSPEDTDRISALLRRHDDLHREFWDFFQQLHGSQRVSHNPPDGDRKRAEPERPVGAKNISMTSNGEKVVEWTREADRAILTACQQRGASRRTFRQVSVQLGNKTAHQVSLRFHDLISLFKQSTSCSSEDRPISRQEAALD